MRAPGLTSAARLVKVVAIRLEVPTTSRDVIVTWLPVFNRTGSCPLSRPVRIFGPCRSCRIHTVLSSLRAARRILAILRACSSCVPWEKFSRATSMPRRIRSRRVDSSFDAGPMVAMILARRALRARDSVRNERAAGSFSAIMREISPETRSNFPCFKISCSCVTDDREEKQFPKPRYGVACRQDFRGPDLSWQNLASQLLAGSHA